MKAEYREETSNNSCDLSVGLSPRKEDVALGMCIGGEAYVYRFLPASSAVKLWRCFMGAIEYTSAATTDGGSVRVEYLNKGGVDTWNVRVDESGGTIVLNADEAMAIAWGLERAVQELVSMPLECHEDPKVEDAQEEAEKSLKEVWVLSSTYNIFGVGKGSGDRMEVYRTYDDARGRVREFLREHVNSVIKDDDRDVDNILDDIFAKEACFIGPDGSGHMWTYSGRSMGFVVCLALKEVRG